MRVPCSGKPDLLMAAVTEGFPEREDIGVEFFASNERGTPFQAMASFLPFSSSDLDGRPRHKVEVDFHAPRRPEAYGPTSRRACSGVLQEALQNAVRHSAAARLAVSLEAHAGRRALSVTVVRGRGVWPTTVDSVSDLTARCDRQRWERRSAAIVCAVVLILTTILALGFVEDMPMLASRDGPAFATRGQP
jgi:hypothetical protein